MAAAWSKTQVGRHSCQLALLRGGELGERSLADAEHVVADAESGDLVTDGHDSTCQVESGNRVLRSAEPEREAHGVGLSCHEVLRPSVEPGGADLDEHLVGGDGRNRAFAEPQLVGGPVAVLDDGGHRRVLADVGRAGRHDAPVACKLVGVTCTLRRKISVES